MYFMAKKSKHGAQLNVLHQGPVAASDAIEGADKLNHSKWLAFFFGSIILLYCLYKAFILPEAVSLSFITPNFINLFLLGLGIVCHTSFSRFLDAVNQAIGGASGILIQFPLYFGIMGIMNHSGLVSVFSDFFVSISNEITFPIFTFLSAGIVNVFVPSGGGQWGVQGLLLLKPLTNSMCHIGKPSWHWLMAISSPICYNHFGPYHSLVLRV